MDGLINSPFKKRGLGRGLLIKKAMDKLESMRVAGKASPNGNSSSATHFVQYDKEPPMMSELSYDPFEDENTCEEKMELDLNANVLSQTGKGEDCSLLPENCPFCHRPPKMIVCRACGHTLAGRVRVVCDLHPTVVHLMDIDCCPSCKGINLKEFS